MTCLKGRGRGGGIYPREKYNAGNQIPVYKEQGEGLSRLAQALLNLVKNFCL